MGTEQAFCTAAEYPRLYRVTVVLCAACIAGDGDTCWTPGCALWASTVPDHPMTCEHMEHAP